MGFPLHAVTPVLGHSKTVHPQNSAFFRVLLFPRSFSSAENQTFFFPLLHIEYMEEEMMSLVRVAGGFSVAVELGFRFRRHEGRVA